MHISNFEMIGFHDPYPNEPNYSNFSIPCCEDDEVYKFEEKQQNPFLHYFPSRLMMFKLMRACIGIKNIENLWYLKLEKKIHLEASPQKKRAKMKHST